MHKLSPEFTTAVILFVYVFIAIIVIITCIVALFFWELIQSFRNKRR